MSNQPIRITGVVVGCDAGLQNHWPAVVALGVDHAANMIRVLSAWTKKPPATIAEIESALRTMLERYNARLAVCERAKVKVDERMKQAKDGTPRKVVKWASAHDFRRSFGERWADRVMPHRLMELTRYADIQTTMRFYVGRNAAATAEAVWASGR